FSVVFGVSMDIEFKGGAMVTMGYQGEADVNAVKSAAESTLGVSNTTVQTGNDISGNQTMTLTMPGTTTLTTEDVDSLLNTLNEQFPDNDFVQNEISNVDATIG